MTMRRFTADQVARIFTWPTDQVRFLNRVAKIAIPRADADARRTDHAFFLRGVNRGFEARDAAEAVDIDLYDEIGFWGIDAKAFRGALRSAGSRPVNLRINSPGGDVFDGMAMMNDLIAHPGQVNVTVTGIAASAASVVAMGGDSVTMAAGSFLMIHNAWGVMVGDRNDALHFADIAGKIDSAIADTYASRSDEHDQAEFAAMMDAETWFTADDAVAAGLADSADGGAGGDVANAARFDLSAYHNAPDAWHLAGEAPKPATKRDIERTLRDAGLSKSFAAAMVAGGFNTADKRRRDADADDTAALADLCDALRATTQALS